MAERVCTHCGEGSLRRVARVGFLENLLSSVFGYFPWKCKTCGTRVRIRGRGEYERRKRNRDAGPGMRSAERA